MKSPISCTARLRAVLALLLSLFLSHAALAATITVTSALDNGGTCPGADCTLRQAVAVAAANDVINFALTGTGTITLYTGTLYIPKALSIVGPGADRLVVEGNTGLGFYFPVITIVGLGGETPRISISGMTIANGTAQQGNSADGGGIHVENAGLTLESCTVSGNKANGLRGGGIFLTGNGVSVIRKSTISGNTALDGAGIWTEAMVNIDNSTISGNIAANSAAGIGIDGTSSIGINNSTIVNNTATGPGGGTFNISSQPVTIKSSIVALNTGLNYHNLAGTTISGGYNMIGPLGQQSFSTTPTDQSSVSAADLNLGPLAFNGGPTKTHALGSGSKAIEAGFFGGYATDQRGFARTVDSPIYPSAYDGTDVGAYEVQADVLPGCGASRVVTNTADAGPESLRDVLANVCAGSTITFAPGIGSTIALTSALVIDKGVTIAGPGAKLLTVARSAAANTPGFGVVRIADVTKGNVTISGLTVANGQGTDGGGVANEGQGLLTLKGMAISGNAASGHGGGVYNLGAVKIVDSTISLNTAVDGGAIYHDLTAATLTLIGSTLSGNIVAGDGGGIRNRSDAAITHSTIAGNVAGGRGGGVFNTATARVRNTIIASNTATVGSPDFHQTLSTEGFNLVGNGTGMTPTSLLFSDQIGTAGAPINPLLGSLADNGGPTQTRAPGAGSPALDKGSAYGLVDVTSNGLLVPLATDQRGFIRTIDSPGITNASGGDGTDIGAHETQADQLAGCSATVVTTNTDNVPGSLRAVIASACVGSNITFAANVRGTIALTAGELQIGKTLSISGPGANLLSVARSAAAGNFRIFNITSATSQVTISGLTVANGSGDFGGGIQNQGAILNLSGMSISGNHSVFVGGGLYLQGGTTNIVNSSISGNTSSIGLGGISNSGTLTLTSSTVSGNMGTGGNGGGLGNTGTATITNSTIASNTATGKGGGILAGGTMTVKSSIIALNTAPGGSPDINLAITSAGFNLIGDGSGMTSPTLASDQVGTAALPIDPLLDILKDNGGPTPTRALLPGSPAIDRGTSEGLAGVLAVDQRGAGFIRKYDDPFVTNNPAGDGTDIGAFEATPIATLDIDLSVTATKYDPATDGMLVLRYLLGVSGNALIAGTLGGTAARNDAIKITSYLDAIRTALDIDLDGNLDPLTDGLLIARYLRGLRGTALTAGATAAGATRTTQQIEDYLGTLTP